MWIQNLIIFLIVGGCAAYLTWQAIRAFQGRKSKLGSCCAKGCATVADEQMNKPMAKVQFMPVEMLGRKRPH